MSELNSRPLPLQEGEEDKRSKKEHSILEYARREWRGFDSLAFSPVDSLILSQLSYLRFDGLVPSLGSCAPGVKLQSLYRAENMEGYTRRVISPKKSRELLAACCASPRFRDIELNYYCSEVDSRRERQFAAVTFKLPTGRVYAAFRGSDSTVVGWKENFNMFFEDAVPSELSGRDYLSAVAGLTEGELIVGGHSKGGRIAVYSASACPESVRNRISRVYNHDGPGPSQKVMETGGYRRIKNILHTTLPHGSIVGALFADDDYSVVKSSGINGIFQHDPFSWKISGTDFVYKDELAKSSYKINSSVRQMMTELTPAEREIVVDTIFKILSSTQAESFHDLFKSFIARPDRVIDTVKSIDRATYSKVKIVLGEMFKILLSQDG